MTGSRSTPHRHSDRSSLDALNRTIEGLEARIEGLMSGASRDGRTTRPEHVHEQRSETSSTAHEAPYRRTATQNDPISEIRERQRVLAARREPRADRSYPHLPGYEATRSADSRHHEVRRPDAYRPQERPAQPRFVSERTADVPPAATLRREAIRVAKPEGTMEEIAQALVNLRQELKQDISEGVAREMTALRAELRSITSVAEEQRLNDELRNDLARLAEGIDQLGHHALPEAAGLRAEFEELRAVMDGLAREESVRRMETRWQGLEERIHDLDSPALREELVSLAYRIDDIKSQLGGMSDSPVIKALEQKLIAVATAMEQLGSRMQPADAVLNAQFAALDERLDEISRAIAAGSRASAAASLDQSSLQRLEGRLGVLGDQMEAISRAAQKEADPAAELSVRIEALTDRIEELADEQTAARLEERLDQLSRMLEQRHAPAQPDLTDHLVDISRKIDDLQRGSVNGLLAERLDYLARRIEEMEIWPNTQPAVDHPAFGRIEGQLTGIAAMLDEAAAAPRHDEDALRNLEDQIAHLSTLISQSPGTVPAELDNRMAAIESYMVTNDEYVIEAARQAAEAVVEAYSRNATGATDVAALSALAEDLRHLEDLTRASDQRTHTTFEALHGTLVKIADRLDGMEERIAASAFVERLSDAPVRGASPAVPNRPEALEGMPAQQQQMPAYRPEEALVGDISQTEELAPAGRIGGELAAQNRPAKPSLLTELSRRLLPGSRDAAGSSRTLVEPAPSLDPSDVLPSHHENDLLEPGSGAPDVKKILERVRASQAAGEFDNARSSGTARADYIAAARRAAKAAAEETDPSQGTPPPWDNRKPAKVPKGKGSGAAILRHRRPILMAVGAVLLTLLALPLAKTLSTNGSIPSSSPTIAEPAAPGEEPTVQDRLATDGNDHPGEPQASETAGMEPGVPADLAPTKTDPVRSVDEPAATSPENAGTDAADAAPPEAVEPAHADPAATAIAVPPGIEPKSLSDAAASGDPNALFEIATRFTDGRGVAADMSEAANWYKLAADRGLAPAQYRLANLFEKGTGVSRDIGKALNYYRQAADAGNASAMHNLAVLHASGAAGEPDFTAAAGWFAKAAELGVADSQFNLAILYARGNGVKQDLEESYRWFSIAANSGDQDAAQKRDEVAKAMRKEQLESARAQVSLWKAQALDPNANSVNLPEEWSSSTPLTTGSVDMEKAIRNIQAILNKNGFDAGAPDGKAGAKTVAAIKAFQTSVGQQATGKIDDALVTELLARNK